MGSLKSRVKRRLVTGGGLACTAAALPSIAGADVYCVDVVGGDCTSAQAGVQDALDAAEANPGDDTVRLGAMAYTAPPGTGFQYQGGNGSVSIVGQGQSATTLGVPAQPDVPGIHRVLTLDGSSGGQSVSDLTVRLPIPTPPNVNFPQYRGIEGTNATLSRVTVNAPSSQSSGFGVIFIVGGGTVDESTINLQTGSGMTGISSTGATTIEETTVTAELGIGFAEGNLSLARSRVRASIRGLELALGTATVANSTFDLGGSDGTAIQVGNTNGGFAGAASLSADHVTLANGGANATGLSVFAADVVAADSSSAMLTNSVISGMATPIQRSADQGDSANVTAAYSNYDATSNVSVNANMGTGSITGANITNLAPGFVNAPAGDFRLGFGSQLIDRGDPAPPAPGETDLDGNARAISGLNCANFNAPPRRDIGAYEFASFVPTLCPAPFTPQPQLGPPVKQQKKCKKAKKKTRGAVAAKKKCKRKKRK